MIPGEDQGDVGGAGAPMKGGAPYQAPDLTREYRAADITVQWHAARCIHSGNCARALNAVFDPKRRPWVDPTAGSPDDIAAAVLRCPSGALHFVRHDAGAQEQPDRPMTLTPIRNGPLYARGDVEVRAHDGSVLRRDTRVSLCRCTLSRQVPFCDNSCHTAHWREVVAAPSARTGGTELPPSSDERA